MSAAPLYDPKFVAYTKASQVSAHQNGVYKVFPKHYDSVTKKYTTKTIELNEKNLEAGYVFFPGARVAFYTGDHWWTKFIADTTKPFLNVALEVITNAEKVLVGLTYGNVTVSLYGALIHPQYAQEFTDAARRFFPVAEQHNAILVFMNNLKATIDFFMAHDAAVIAQNKSIETKGITLKEAHDLIQRIKGITKSRVSVEGKPTAKKTETVSVTKLNYTKEILAEGTRSGKWFDLTNAVISKGAKFKGITTSDSYPQPDRHIFYKNKDMPLNLYYSVKASAEERAAVENRVHNFMTARSIPTGPDFWAVGKYVSQFSAPAPPAATIQTGMIMPLSSRPIAPVSQVSIMPTTAVPAASTTGSFGPVVQQPGGFGANPVVQQPGSFGAGPVVQQPGSFGANPVVQQPGGFGANPVVQQPGGFGANPVVQQPLGSSARAPTVVEDDF